MAVVFLVALAIGGGAYWQFASPQLPVIDSLTKPKDQADISSIVNMIRQSVEIPSNETPTVATVTDQDKVRSQPFFASAQTGDKIVVFAQAKKAVLFRPSSGKIINIITLSDNRSAEPKSASASAQSESVAVSISNGTTKKGLAGLYESKIKEALPESQISLENAAKDDYQTTQVIAINQQKKSLAEKLANQIGANIAVDLPEGEVKPKADILIILGHDKIEE